MWFQALICIILAAFFGWILPEPFNVLSVIAGVLLFFWTLYWDAGESYTESNDVTWGQHPYYQSKPPTDKPYTEIKRLVKPIIKSVEREATISLHEPLGSKESKEMNILYKETRSGHRLCMRCGTQNFAGFILPRAETNGTDAYFFCFSCKNTVNDNEQLVKDARKRMDDELKGNFDLHLDERHIMILDAIMHHFQMKDFKELDVKQYCERFFIIESDIVDLERKIHIFAEALRSSHPKVVNNEPTDDEVVNWMHL